MKGMLMKDIRLMANQKQFFAVMGFMCILFLALYKSPEFAISYMTLMFSMFTSSTISYDEYDNGASYLFTLPISRTGYVREKYFFGIVATTAAAVLMAVLSILAYSARGIGYEGREIWMTAAAAGAIAIVLLAFQVPIQLKFGSEKGKMAFLLVFGSGFLIAWLMAVTVKKSGVNIGRALDRLVRLKFGEMILGFCLVCIAATVISYVISIRIIRKKEY